MTAVFDPKPILVELPNLPGVYRMKNAAGDVIYVGKARELKKRVSSYFVKDHASPRTAIMVAQIVGIETTITASESEALILENNLIKSLAPRYNVLFRDDKSYPYIMVTGRQFPQIRFYRGSHVKPHRYFGPFPSSLAVRDTIQHLQKIFKLRTCDDTVFAHRARPCLLHQIGRCSAPCVGLIDVAAYAKDIENAVMFLDGKESDVVDEINRKMNAAADDMQYEIAARYRDQVRVLQQILSKQFVETTSERDADIIAVAEFSGTWCVNLAMVRGGRHLGDKPFFPANVYDADRWSILDAFIEQHYAERIAPTSVIVDGDYDTADWQETLSARAERQVRVVTRPQGEARQWMLMASKNATYAIAQRLADRASQEAKLSMLNEMLGLDGVARIECFDISHTMGESTVASCVVFDNGAMQSSQYRLYNITGITPGDDYAAMRDVLTRRYKKIAEQLEDEATPHPSHPSTARPDLILIDGGKGQLTVAEEVMSELGLADITLLGVAKGEERKAGMETLIFGAHTAHGTNGEHAREELHLPKDNVGFHLIQQIRDEAHRFAITGHRARRAKTRNTSTLEDIKGVGPKRRKALLQKFGGLQGVVSASVEDLSRVEGISRELAEAIYNELH